jgi:hypothetical protein
MLQQARTACFGSAKANQRIQSSVEGGKNNVRLPGFFAGRGRDIFCQKQFQRGLFFPPLGKLADKVTVLCRTLTFVYYLIESVSIPL